MSKRQYKPQKRRRRRKEQLDEYGRLFRRPDLQELSDSSWDFVDYKQDFYSYRCDYRLDDETQSLSNCSSSSLESTSSSDIISGSQNMFDSESTSSSDIISGSQNMFDSDLSIPAPLRASSPVDFPLQLHDLNSPKEEFCQLYPGARISKESAETTAELFCSRFNLSDEASKILFDFVKAILPAGNVFPTGNSYVEKSKNKLRKNCRWQDPEENEPKTESKVCVLTFKPQIRDIVEKNLKSIFSYAKFRKEHPDSDFNVQFSKPIEEDNEVLTIGLNFFADGVQIKKSTPKPIWPVWVQINDLPPVLRYSRKNMVLAALFVGVGNDHPNWDELVPRIRGEILSHMMIKSESGRKYVIHLEGRLLIADLVAKAKLLKMYQFNGFNGCHYCTAEGITIGVTHSYYPYGQEWQIRKPEVNDFYVQRATYLKLSEKEDNNCGVKGTSAFSTLVPNLPLTAPNDYMHCVLIGVFPETLKFCKYKFKKFDKEKFEFESKRVELLKCPREMIGYSRRIRPPDEMPHFKANEFFNWLLYISPFFFLDNIDAKLYNHLMQLVVGVRLLLESSEETSVELAERHLKKFCKEISEIRKDGKSETINVHSLLHLPDQVRRFGTLRCFSAMAFEAANKAFKEVFSGSVRECEIICRRILQRHHLSSKEVDEEGLSEIFSKLNNSRPKDTNFSSHMAPTPELKKGQRQYPKATFFNRQIVNHVYFDSTAYARSRQGNCFVVYKTSSGDQFGKILYFMKLNGPPHNGAIQAVLTVYDKTDDIGPVSGFYYRVKKTAQENMQPIEKLKKVFAYPLNNSEFLMAKISSTFEHS